MSFLHSDLPSDKMAREKAAPYSNRALARDMLGFLGEHKIDFLGVTIIRLLSEISWLYPAYALSQLVTLLGAYTLGADTRVIFTIVSLWVVVSIWRHLSIYISQMHGFAIAERVYLKVQEEAIGKLFRLDIAWHERENTGNKLKRIERGGESIYQILRIWIVNIISIGVNSVGILFVLSQFDLPLTLSIALFTISYAIIASYFTKRAADRARIVNEAQEEMSGLLFESIGNMRSVKVMSMGPWLMRRIREKSSDLRIKIEERMWWFQTASLTKNIWGQGFRVASAAYIVWQITKGQQTVGFLVLYYGYYSYFWSAIENLANISQEIVIAKASIARLKELLDEPVGIENDRGKRRFPKEWHAIELRNLSFSYNKQPVLSGVSFTLRRGEKVGIVGLSGAGKSTLFKLLLKEYENYTGDILIDDVPLRRISKLSYFERVAAVLQETEVFNLSLHDNVVISNMAKEQDGALFKRSLDIAHVTDFLHKLPLGPDTLIGEKGVKLSGGERQRLGLARAVFKEPEILLLDEATSHLDIESEQRIQDSLHRFFEKVTAVVIAHRLSTIKEMDRIIVFENGTILEEGSFEELYARRGRFFTLWEKQKLN
ncbi:MAG: ABC transporter ATP-binding protein [Patescibacteria group bacterium]